MIGELAALGTALAWAIAGLMLKRLSGRFRPFFLNNIRCVAAVVLLAVFLFATGGFALSPIPLGSGLITIAGTFIAIGLGESLFIMSFRHIDLSRAYPISLCGYPLITVAIALPWLHEEISGLALLGIATVLVGLYLIAFPGGALLVRFQFSSAGERTGLIILLLSVLAYGVGTVLIKLGIGDLDLAFANFLRYGGTALLLVPFTFPQWGTLRTYQNKWQDLSLAAVSGVLSFGIGGILFLVALDRSGAALTSVLSSTSPLFLLPMSVFFLKERVTAKLLAGVVLSVLGICLVFLPRLVV